MTVVVIDLIGQLAARQTTVMVKMLISFPYVIGCFASPAFEFSELWWNMNTLIPQVQMPPQ